MEFVKQDLIGAEQTPLYNSSHIGLLFMDDNRLHLL